jgi:type IV secretory pathway protease TraF
MSIKNKYYCLWLLLLIVLIVTGSLLDHWGYGFVYQGSDSMPKGWYVYTPPPVSLKRGQVVVFKLTPVWNKYLVDHHWLLPHALLMKPIAAIPGDFVCIQNHELSINHQPITSIVVDYAPGKPLPQLSFCRTLLPGEYWMVSTHILRSFDSRYFGPIQQAQIVGWVRGKKSINNDNNNDIS